MTNFIKKYIIRLVRIANSISKCLEDKSKPLIITILIGFIGVLISLIVSWINFPKSSSTSFIGIEYSLNTSQSIDCYNLHGVTLQPYWIIAISSILGQCGAAIQASIVKYFPAKESFFLVPANICQEQGKVN